MHQSATICREYIANCSIMPNRLSVKRIRFYYESVNLRRMCYILLLQQYPPSLFKREVYASECASLFIGPRGLASNYQYSPLTALYAFSISNVRVLDVRLFGDSPTLQPRYPCPGPGRAAPWSLMGPLLGRCLARPDSWRLVVLRSVLLRLLCAGPLRNMPTSTSSSTSTSIGLYRRRPVLTT